MKIEGGISFNCFWGYTTMFLDKNLENRKKQLKSGWYALHISTKKVRKNDIENLNLYLKSMGVKKEITYKDFNKYSGHIVGLIHIDSAIQTEFVLSQKWVVPSCGKWCHIIDKKIILNSPIKTRGWIHTPWKIPDGVRNKIDCYNIK